MRFGFNFPDDALCYDYTYGTCSLAGRYYSASKTIKRPRESISERAEERWFIAGRDDGVVVMYGNTNLAQPALADTKRVFGNGGKYSIFSSSYQIGTVVYVDSFFFAATDVGSTIIWDDGTKAVITGFIDQLSVQVDRSQKVAQQKFYVFESLYSAVLASGRGSFSDSNNEKMLRSYVPELSSNSEIVPFQVEILTSRNTSEAEDLAVTHEFTNPDQENLLPLMLRSIFFKDRITVTDQYKQLILSKKTFEVSKNNSRSMTRF